jgi:hypothetical protein
LPFPDTTVELSFGADADIVQVHDSTVVFPEPVFQYTPLTDLSTQDPSETPTAYGVIVDIGPKRRSPRAKVLRRKSSNSCSLTTLTLSFYAPPGGRLHSKSRFP